MKPKRFWAWIGIAALGTLALFRWADASGIVTSAYSVIENAGSALTMRQVLNFVNGGCADNATAKRTDCTISGGSGGGGAILSAVSLYVTSSGSPQYMPLSGASTWGVSGTKIMSSTESEVQQLSPATTTLSTLYALLATAPGSGNSIAITLRDNGTNTSVTCTIATAATTCSDLTDTASINPADALDYSIVISGSPVLTTTLAVSIGVGSVAVNANPAFTISNAASTGTTVNTLTKLTGAPSTAVITATSDTGGAVGITTAGAGTSGTATITTAGKLSCVFDGATTAGDYVQISSSTAGNCHDTGSASYPSSGGQVLGRTLSTNASGGTYTMDLFPSEIQPGSGGGGGLSVSGFYLYDGTNYYIGPALNIATLPSASSFSWLTTQGTASVATTKNALVLTAPSTGGDNIRCYGQNIGSDSTLTVAMSLAALPVNYINAGVAFVESSTGKIIDAYTSFAEESGTVPATASMGVDYYSNATTFVGHLYGQTQPGTSPGDMRWLQLIYTSGSPGTITLNYSTDGQSWVTMYTESANGHFTTAPNQWCVEANPNGGAMLATYYSYNAH